MSSGLAQRSLTFPCSLTKRGGKFSPRGFPPPFYEAVALRAPERCFWDGASAATQEAVKEDAQPASPILRTRAAARCFATAINDVNSELASMCPPLQPTHKQEILPSGNVRAALYVLLLYVHLDLAEMKLTPQAHAPDPPPQLSPSFPPAFRATASLTHRPYSTALLLLLPTFP